MFDIGILSDRLVFLRTSVRRSLAGFRQRDGLALHKSAKLSVLKTLSLRSQKNQETFTSGVYHSLSIFDHFLVQILLGIEGIDYSRGSLL